jgi:hypothetical protein
MTAISPKAVDGTIGIDFEKTETSDVYGHGYVVQTDQGPMMWVRAGATITEGQLVKVSFTNSIQTVTLLDTTISGTEDTTVGVAHKAIASGSYGWIFRGPFTYVQALLAASVTALSSLTTTATAGTLGTGGDAVEGLVNIDASGAGGLTYCRAALSLATNV